MEVLPEGHLHLSLEEEAYTALGIVGRSVGGGSKGGTKR